VPAVGRSLYDKLVEQLKLAGQPVPGEADQANADQSGEAQAAAGLPTSWDDIGVGHQVIAHENAVEGWWEAIVLARDGDVLTLKSLHGLCDGLLVGGDNLAQVLMVHAL
jgi:hypothetical protein